jgi:hypothetical protein
MNEDEDPRFGVDPEEEEELTEQEREAFRALPREMIPPASLEDRVVDVLRGEGLLHAGVVDARVARWPRRASTWAGAAAAAVALFASGMVMGQRSATRSVADAMAQRLAGDPVAQAAQVQEAGSDYVRAVAHLADLAAKGDPGAVAPGREAARVALHAAALELARLSPDDPTLRLVLAVLEDRLHTAVPDSVGGARTTIWF